jgi:hypothetical protein
MHLSLRFIYNLILQPYSVPQRHQAFVKSCLNGTFYQPL